ncbi:MAG: hypothetical protein E4H38_07485 [Gemmatimonadales bacterium]|nr:MAG: hypothetical protein E4H38_07485 [Gemmatimonadales bacterium]
MRASLPAMSLAVAWAVAAACTSEPSSPKYNPDIPTAWAPSVTNQWFVLEPGAIATFAAVTAEGAESTSVEVLPATRDVNGVTATAVLDRVLLDGSLIEETYDWYAQDIDGNVWYLGEDSKEYDNGMVVSSAGSWEWGVGGALPGIIMWADPSAHIGEAYRQEYDKGNAEDWAKVLRVGETITVPAGTYTGCIKTEDWNGLSSGREHKYYCSSLGVVLEIGKRGNGTRTELVSFVVP